MVERQLPKLNVAGSIPVSRSKYSKRSRRFVSCNLHLSYRLQDKFSDYPSVKEDR